jgi:hypothetical protein
MSHQPIHETNLKHDGNATSTPKSCGEKTPVVVGTSSKLARWAHTLGRTTLISALVLLVAFIFVWY